jgi:hypothetical protein
VSLGQEAEEEKRGQSGQRLKGPGDYKYTLQQARVKANAEIVPEFWVEEKPWRLGVSVQACFSSSLKSQSAIRSFKLFPVRKA